MQAAAKFMFSDSISLNLDSRTSCCSTYHPSAVQLVWRLELYVSLPGLESAIVSRKVSGRGLNIPVSVGKFPPLRSHCRTITKYCRFKAAVVGETEMTNLLLALSEQDASKISETILLNLLTF